MHWCLQNNLFRERGFEELVDILERAGIPYSEHKVIPFVGELHPDVDIAGPVICMGSYSMRHVAKRKGWWPGVFDLEFFDYEAQKRAWPGHMLNYDLVVARLDAILDVLPAEEVFMRPIADSKFFAGGVMNRAEITDMVTKVVDLKEDYGDSLSASTLVMAASTKVILREYRTWVVAGRVATASLYKSGNRVLYSDVVDQDVIEYANARAAEFSPLEAYVLDVAIVENGLKVVEANTFNAAGLYSANVGLIVDAIERLEQARQD